MRICLLIELIEKQTVVPGFDFNDHDFLTLDDARKMVKEEEIKYLGWLLR